MVFTLLVPQLSRLLDQLEAGDVLTVTRLDRLARSTRDLLSRHPPTG
jgi:DNA invertase Pin-like site-specific DNA recombinase